MLTRRQVLGGALGLGGTALAAPFVRDWVHPVPESLGPVPAGPVGTLVSDSFTSAAMRGEVRYGIAYPHEVVRGLPVLLELHGRGDDHRDAFGSHALGAFLSDAVRRGAPPFVVVAVDGGDHSYWHQRSSGEDPQSMLVDELLPRLAHRGLLTNRIAVGGWSMGGFGAILLAQRLGAARVAALVPDSPALFRRPGETPGGAFDGRTDFERHDVFTALPALRGIPLRLSCGLSDPFLPAVRRFLRDVPDARADLAPGRHNARFWRHAAPGQLAFAGAELARQQGQR